MDVLQEAQEGGLEETSTSPVAYFSLSNPSGLGLCLAIWNHHILQFPAGEVTHSRPTAGQAPSSICVQMASGLLRVSWGPKEPRLKFRFAREDFPVVIHLKICFN